MKSSGDVLRLRPIQDSDEALAIAHIRNEGREFMTHNTAHISMIEQVNWFYNTYLPEYAAGDRTAYIGVLGARAVAYGMITRDQDDSYWLTGIVAAAARGQGLGRALFEQLEANVPADEINLDVRADNVVARALYEKLGYEYVASDNDSDIMVMIKKVQNGSETTEA